MAKYPFFNIFLRLNHYKHKRSHRLCYIAWVNMLYT